MNYKIKGYFIALFITVFQSVSAQSISYKYVSVDGHKMQYQMAGRGAATVVFENGHDSELNTWDNIFDEVSKFVKVVRYNRLGYGGSEMTDKPRTFKQIATELQQMLHAAKISPPYILVGHSMGGAVIRVFASLFPGETSGLVLIDPFNEFEANGVPAEIIKSEMEHGDSAMRSLPTIAYNEFLTLKKEILEGFPEMNSFNSVTDVPLVLLIAGKNGPPNWSKNLTDLFKSKFENLSDSRLVLFAQSPHYIQNYDAPMVIESIRRVVFPDVTPRLRKTLKEKGVDSAIAEYKKIKSIYPKDFVRERLLNTLGYDALNSGDAQSAIKLFSLNVQLYPDSYNVYDSLAEAYMKSGSKSAAIRNYEKSLKMNPANSNAKKMLKKLKAG